MQNGCTVIFYIIHRPHSRSLWVFSLHECVYVSVCMCARVSVQVSLRSVHFPASPYHKSWDGAQEHCENCAITHSRDYIYCMTTPNSNNMTDCMNTFYLRIFLHVKVILALRNPLTFFFSFLKEWCELPNWFSQSFHFSACLSSRLQNMEQAGREWQDGETTRTRTWRFHRASESCFG